MADETLMTGNTRISLVLFMPLSFSLFPTESLVLAVRVTKCFVFLKHNNMYDGCNLITNVHLLIS